MEFEKGMYVRTDKGIAQIIMPDRLVYIVKTDIYDYVSKSRISKASHNIKALIKEGDIISYEYPTGLGMIGYENVTVLPELLKILQDGENNHEYIIKSIITKEKIESMSYKVG